MRRVTGGDDGASDSDTDIVTRQSRARQYTELLEFETRRGTREGGSYWLGLIGDAVNYNSPAQKRRRTKQRARRSGHTRGIRSPGIRQMGPKCKAHTGPIGSDLDWPADDIVTRFIHRLTIGSTGLFFDSLTKDNEPDSICQIKPPTNNSQITRFPAHRCCVCVCLYESPYCSQGYTPHSEKPARRCAASKQSIFWIASFPRMHI